MDGTAAFPQENGSCKMILMRFSDSLGWRKHASMRLERMERKCRLSRPEQKIVCWKRNLVDSFSKPVQFVFDLLFDTFLTAKACLELWRPSHIKICELDAYCFKANTAALVETYVGQIMKEKSTISRSDEVMGVRKKYSRVLEWLRGRKQMKSWKMPVELCGVQIFTWHITHFL